MRRVSQVSHGGRFSGEKRGSRATLATVHGCDDSKVEAEFFRLGVEGWFLTGLVDLDLNAQQRGGKRELVKLAHQNQDERDPENPRVFIGPVRGSRRAHFFRSDWLGRSLALG